MQFASQPPSKIGNTKLVTDMRRGFTIVELLIVIVVIAILAAITVVAYNGIQDRARSAKMKADVAHLAEAMTAAKQLSGKTIVGLTTTPTIGSDNTGTGRGCWSLPIGTDLAALPKTAKCWTDYEETLQIISEASGVNVNGLIDPYGRPYYIDQSEGENVGGNLCIQDKVGAYRQPFVAGSGSDDTAYRTTITNISAGC